MTRSDPPSVSTWHTVLVLLIAVGCFVFGCQFVWAEYVSVSLALAEQDNWFRFDRATLAIPGALLTVSALGVLASMRLLKCGAT